MQMLWETCLPGKARLKSPEVEVLITSYDNITIYITQSSYYLVIVFD